VKVLGPRQPVDKSLATHAVAGVVARQFGPGVVAADAALEKPTRYSATANPKQQHYPISMHQRTRPSDYSWSISHLSGEAAAT
jgi:hypothetical protein